MKPELLIYLLRIFRLIVAHRLDQDIFPKMLSVSRILPKKQKELSAPEKLKMVLEDLGPLWVKFGQLLSTRYDLIPEKWLKTLSELQDSVQPFPDKIAIKILKKEIPNFSKKFLIHGSVLASASIAQVYAATMLENKQEVVIKILRPGVIKQIKRDVKCLKLIAKIFTFILHDSKRLHLTELVSEIEHSLQQEVDLLSEAANAASFKRNFAEDERLSAPGVFWEYSTKRVLVLERFYGTPIYNLKHLKKQGANLPDLAKLGVELFFTQVLRDSFFHADMHPGNILVNTKRPNTFELVDFGIVGSLNGKDQRYIAENMLAFFKRDYRKVAVLHVESGWVPKDTRIEHFEAAIRKVCEPIFAKPLKDISFGQLFLQLIKTAREFKTEIQPQLILLQKTLIQIEALGRMLDPDLDLWTTVQPQLEKWVNGKMGWKGFKDKTKDNLPFWLERAPDLPEILLKHLTKESPLPEPRTSPFWYFLSGSMTSAFLFMVVIYVL